MFFRLNDVSFFLLPQVAYDGVCTMASIYSKLVRGGRHSSRIDGTYGDLSSLEKCWIDHSMASIHAKTLVYGQRLSLRTNLSLRAANEWRYRTLVTSTVPPTPSIIWSISRSRVGLPSTRSKRVPSFRRYLWSTYKSVSLLQFSLAELRNGWVDEEVTRRQSETGLEKRGDVD